MVVDTKPKLNLPQHRPGTPPWPTVLALTLVVLAAHGWLLRQGPDSLELGGREPTRVTLSTRSIVAESAPTEPAAAKPAPPARKSGGANTLAMQTPSDAGAAEEPPPVAPADPNPAPQASVAPLPAAAASSPAEPPPQFAPASQAVPAVEPAAGPASANAQTLEPQPTASAAPASTPASPPAPEQRLALALPGSARLNYQLSGRARGFEYSGSGQIDWQQDGQRYQARLAISFLLLASRSQTSVGEIGPEGLSPRRYSERARGELAVHFQPELGRISFSANSPPVAWQAGAQDRLSLTFQLAAMLAGDPSRFKAGTMVSIPTASSRNLEPWDFTVMGSENVSLPIGPQTALRLRREPRHQYDQTIEIWFAPALGYLPVRILLSQGNGDLADQRLISIERP